ncbi:MAG: Flp family type IVb pilin [Proteobacteria bacterium]|nr:Flp family type IVb pilin [Pseudomonadota bacterium]
MWQSIKKFGADEEGATAIEYGLIAALIAVAIIVSVGDIGTKLKAAFEFIVAKLPTPN